MAIFDVLTTFSNDQGITADAVSTSTYDTGDTLDSGAGGELQIHCIVTEAFDNLTSLDVEFVESAAAALTSQKVLSSKQAIVRATLVAGYEFYLPFPAGENSKQYLGMNYDVNGTNPSAGSISARMVGPGSQNNTSYVS